MTIYSVFKSLKRKIALSVVLFYALFIVITLFVVTETYAKYSQEKIKFDSLNKLSASFDASLGMLGDYRALLEKIEEAKTKYLNPPIDLKDEEAMLLNLKKYLISGDYNGAKKIYDQLSLSLNKKIADEDGKGELAGKINNGLKATIKIFQEGNQIAEFETAEDGSFTYRLPPGKYTMKISVSGYSEYSSDVEIKTGEKNEKNISLSKIFAASSQPAAPAPAPASSGVYSYQTVKTERGSFSVHLLTIDLNQYSMRIDTAADGDCADNCPVKSLSSYVSQNGGFAGVHGTYFCPTSYSSCAGKTNSFYYKLFNTRLNSKINWSNGLGDYLPFLYVDQSGAAHYSDTWSGIKDSGNISAGISCRPHLVENGAVVVTDGDLDSDKERSSKISRGFIGVNGQTIYAGVVTGATVIDSAYTIKGLGIPFAFNIDGGGTTALFYEGSYKIGPGRDMPNAIVFIRK